MEMKRFGHSLLLSFLFSNAYSEAPPATPNANSLPKPMVETATTSAPIVGTSENTINCNYHIKPGQKVLDTKLIATWAENATIQAFTFSPMELSKQMDALKDCFTTQGWKGFTEALHKSGNLESIKTHQLNVSSQKVSDPVINTLKDGQWKVTTSINVVYQNSKQKVTQDLNISIIIAHKAPSELGILQLIATPRKPEEGGANPALKSEPSSSIKPAATAPTGK